MGADPAYRSGFQLTADRAIARLFLWAIPSAVRPNHLTVARFVLLVPLVLLLLADRRGWALAVFAVAAATDFLDGAMARTRDQVTNLGIVIDPVADKLLIGTTLALLGWEHLVIKVVVVALTVELLVVLLGTMLWLRKPRGRLPQANVFGKIKMALQSLGGVLFLAGSFLSIESSVEASLVLLWAALLFAALSALWLATSRRRGLG